MDKELAHALLTRARDRIESARRWAYLVALILLGFHVTIFSPFTSDIQRLTRVEASTSRLEDFSTEMEGLRKELDDLSSLVESRIIGAFDRLLEKKVADFEVLNRAVIAVLHSEDPLSGESIQEPGERDLTLQAPVQSTPASSMTIPRAAKLKPELVDHIRRRGNNIEELRLILLPHIRANIIEPRFEELNQELKKSVLPRISKKAKTTIKSLEQLQRNQPRWTEPLSALIMTLQSTVTAASSLEVKPPADDSWWKSVSAKIVTLETLAEGAVHNLNPEDARALGDQMQTDLLDALKKQELIEADLKASILELRTRWNEIQARILEREMHMKGLGDKVGWITIDLEMAVAFFPLMLSVILTGLVVWITRPMRELVLILALAPGPKEELWTWYYRCIGDPLSGLANASAKERRSRWRSLLDAGLWVPIIWVAIASWQVSAWQQVGAIRASAMTLIGWALILGAHFYRRQVMRQAETQPQSVTVA